MLKVHSIELYPEKQTTQVWSCQSFATGLAGAGSRGRMDSPEANLSFGVTSVQPHQMNHSPSFYPEND